MHIYSSILLANLLVTGVTISSPNGAYSFEPVPKFGSVQQQLLAQDSDNRDTCPESGQSDSRGCPRRKS